MYTPRYMNPETLVQSPTLSKVSLERKNAIQTVVDTLVSREGEKAPAQQMLVAVNAYLEEIRDNYRLMQAALKLQEYYRLEVDTEKELARRMQELEQFVPGIGDRLRAANDEQFNSSANDEKYKVAL